MAQLPDVHAGGAADTAGIDDPCRNPSCAEESSARMTTENK
jgi:hypothetical protein